MKVTVDLNGNDLECDVFMHRDPEDMHILLSYGLKINDKRIPDECFEYVDTILECEFDCRDPRETRFTDKINKMSHSKIQELVQDKLDADYSNKNSGYFRVSCEMNKFNKRIL